MAIIFNDQQNRSELQQRIAAELREKQARSKHDGDLHAPEYDVEKSEYLKDREESSLPGWVWLVGLFLTAAAVLALVMFVI